MGCLFSDCFAQQPTYKICMECDLKNKLNQDIMILNVFIFNDDSYRLLFRCSKGHKFYYLCNSTDEYNCIVEYNKTNTNVNNFIQD